MKPRLIERALVALGLVQPVVKGIADSIRDDPATFIMRTGQDNTFSWLTHTSRTFAVMRFDTHGQWMPTYRVINKHAEQVVALGWWDRLILSVAWPEHLAPRADERGALLLGNQ
jgi:hypothetical protein